MTFLMGILVTATLSAQAQTSAQGPTDAAILAAISRGQATSTKHLWEEIKKKHQYRMNRAGFGDPIEKKATVLSDLDRIALEAAQAKQQYRELSIDDVKKTVPLNVVEVLLEANCYNTLYSSSLGKWGPDGGVHVVLKSSDGVIQPIERRAGEADSASIPLYATALYERASLRSWFTFPAQSSSIKTLTVIAISGDGKQKEKEVDNPTVGSQVATPMAHPKATESREKISTSEPPPPPSPPVEISPGMTIGDVQKALGVPDKTTRFGTKEIQVFGNLRVTFRDGRVTDVE